MIVIKHTDVSADERAMLIQRGVAWQLFQIQYSLSDYLKVSRWKEADDIYGGKPEVHTATRDKQFEWIQSILDAPMDRNVLFIISGLTLGRAQGLALTLFRAAHSVWYARRTSEVPVNVPIWHWISGNRNWDKLRDLKREERPVPGFLVLDGLVGDGSNGLPTQDALGKARDLLRRHSDVPRIVVCSGIDPWRLAYEGLRQRPDGIALLGRRD